MKARYHRLTPLLSICALLALSSCAPNDPHSAPRESKPYESVDPALLQKDQLITHLDALTDEMNRATVAEETQEFHHLEMALTPTLESLETIVAKEGNAQAVAIISQLKPLAVQLHEAGHEGNAGMGIKLAAAITRSVTQLKSALGS